MEAASKRFVYGFKVAVSSSISSVPTVFMFSLKSVAHGNEPGGDGALLELLGQWINNADELVTLLEELEIVVLPRYNPDGAVRFQRFLANRVDPNRDHIALNEDHTRNVKTCMNSFNPHVIVDMHEYTPRRQVGGRYFMPFDAMLAAAKVRLPSTKKLYGIGLIDFKPS